MKKLRELCESDSSRANSSSRAGGFCAGGTSFSRRTFLRASALGFITLTGCAAPSDPDAGSSASAESSPEDSISTRSPIYDTYAPETVSMLALGDVLVHRGVYESGYMSDGTRNYDHLFAHVRALTNEVDVAMLNQETLLGGEQYGFSGYPTFNGPQEIATAEVAAGFTVAFGATNHALDKGLAVIEAEASYLREQCPSLMLTGRYDSQEAYDAVSVVEAKGHTIAILNYTESTNGIPLPVPYAVRLFDMSLIESDIAAAREAGAEAIIVVPHWGVEYATQPSDYQRDYAQQICDWGANAIIGSHSHTLQPVEVYTSSVDGHLCPVFFSLGNYVSTQNRMSSMIGGAARITLTFSDDGVQTTEASLEALVTHQASGTDFTVYRLSDYTEERALANQVRLNSGCSEFSCSWCVDWCQDNLMDFDPEDCIVRAISSS